MSLTENKIEEKLRQVNYPGLNRDVVSFGFIKGIQISDGSVTINFKPSTDRDDLIEQMEQGIHRVLDQIDSVKQVTIDREEPSEQEGEAGPPGQPDGRRVAAASPGATETPGSGPMDQQPIPGVKHIIAVASGKGGVGKSTVAVNLASALASQGHKVGLADMDIYGPSAPTMMGVKDRPRVTEDDRILPLEAHGIRIMSIGFVLDETEPVVWRGPMVMKAVTQFLRDVDWGERDYLIIDLPPGTGDAQLTLMQKVPLSGAVIVTTPQDVALIDAQKGVEMFRKLDVKILGIVENMSSFICPDCGSEHEIFGSGGGRKEAMRLNVPFLGGIPLEPEIRAGGDRGEPIIFREEDSEASNVFHQVAEKIKKRAVPVDELPEAVEPGSGI